MGVDATSRMCAHGTLGREALHFDRGAEPVTEVADAHTCRIGSQLARAIAESSRSAAIEALRRAQKPIDAAVAGRRRAQAKTLIVDVARGEKSDGLGDDLVYMMRKRMPMCCA